MNENDLNSFIDDIKDLDPIDSKCRAIDLVNYLENSGLNIQDYKYLNFYSNFIGILDESGNLKEEYKYTIDFETDEENIINEDIDSFLMVFEYPKEYLKKSKIKLYHAATEKFPNNVVLNMGVNVGATKMSKPRWSVYCWDHFGSAVSWAMFTVLREFSRSVWDSSLNKFYIAKKDVKKLIGRKCYVYELNVNIRQVSPGTVSSIREYTVNSNVQADKCLEIEITDSLIKKCAHIVEDMDNVKEKEYNRENTVNPKHRGKILVKLLKKTRYKDRNRAFIYRDIQDGRTNYFDDLSKYKKIVNRKYEETEILYEENEILYEDVNIDKLLIFLDKPKERILNKDIRVYHGSPINIKENKLKPYGINVGATSMSTPRWSVFVWDNEESAKKWALSQAINIKVAKVIFRDNEKALIVNSSSMGREEFMNLILNSNIEGYVYESVIPISKLEMGSSSSIREYTISEEMPIDKRKTIKLSNSLFNQYFEIIDEEELNRVQIDRHGTARNSLLNRILDSTRDIQRLIIRKDLRNNKLSIGDDISNYKDRINKGVKNNTFNLPIREEYLYEEASNSKRKLLENKILSSIAIVDKGGLNVDKYKRLFDSMNDAEFNKYMDDFLNDDDKNFYLEILPNKNEPKIKDIEKLLSTLNVPKEEYVYYKHDGFKDDPIRSREQCSVGYVNVRRLQQILSKKNTYSLDIDNRDSRTGQVTGADKIARISDSELYGLTVFKADEAIKEFYSSRADNMTSKNDMYSKISKYGYVYLNELNNDIKSNQTLNTIDTYLLGAGLKSDLVDSERATAKKILTKQVLDTELEKMTGLKKEEVEIVSEESSNIDNNYIYLAVNDVEKAKGYIDYELTEETNGKYVNYTLEGLESFLKNNNIKDYNYYIKISTENLDLIQLKEDSDSAILKLPFAIDIEESDCKKLNI